MEKEEPFIMMNPEWAYLYARYVIKGRCPMTESFIMKDPAYAFYYARDIIKGRWYEAEPYIIGDRHHMYYYIKEVSYIQLDVYIIPDNILDKEETYMCGYFE